MALLPIPLPGTSGAPRSLHHHAAMVPPASRRSHDGDVVADGDGDVVDDGAFPPYGRDC